MYDDTYFPRMVNRVVRTVCFVYRNDLFLLRFMFIKAVIVNLDGSIENCRNRIRRNYRRARRAVCTSFRNF